MLSFLRKRPEIFLLLILGAIPFLWFMPESIIGKGDHFPYWLNPHETLETDVYLWDLDNMGGSNFMSTTIPHGAFWLVFLTLGFSTGFIQILMQVFAFMGGSLSAYSLVKHPREAKQQLKIIRFSFLRNWKKLANDPIHTLGLFFMKTCEFEAASLGRWIR